MSRQWWPTNKRDIFSLTLKTFCLCWMHRFVSHLIYLSLTKTTMQQRFHPSAKHLLYKYITPRFVGHSFRVKGGTWYFFANSHCAFSFNLKYIFVSLCKYSRTLRMKLLTWCRVYKSGRASRIGPDSGFSLSKYFGLISGLHTKLFYSIRSNDFFLWWRRFVVHTAVTSVSEVIVIFFS